MIITSAVDVIVVFIFNQVSSSNCISRRRFLSKWYNTPHIV